jgi:hypothetical protein
LDCPNSPPQAREGFIRDASREDCDARRRHHRRAFTQNTISTLRAQRHWTPQLSERKKTTKMSVRTAVGGWRVYRARSEQQQGRRGRAETQETGDALTLDLEVARRCADLPEEVDSQGGGEARVGRGTGGGAAEATSTQRASDGRSDGGGEEAILGKKGSGGGDPAREKHRNPAATGRQRALPGDGCRQRREGAVEKGPGVAARVPARAAPRETTRGGGEATLVQARKI